MDQAITRSESFTVSTSTEQTAVTECNTGERATGGGYSQNGPTVSDVFIADSQPAPGFAPLSWSVRVINRSTEAALTLIVYAVCVPV